jgi:glutamyl-Q tRNA(Asp) synthetase
VSVAKSSSATGTTGTAERSLRYRGRFAPSPTGPLHFGSLLAALGSYLEAKTRHGDWLVRIEDLDPPRERRGAADRILTDLERFGFAWDGPILRQSTRARAYNAALEELERLGLTQHCGCSRSQLGALAIESQRVSGDELYHPPRCPNPATDGEGAVRFRAADRDLEFVDRCQGRVRANVGRTVGDFVLRRRDGLHAYQLAVTVDDAEQGITDVVRGADLLASTPRQMALQDALGLPRPGYLHLPLAVDAGGHKLSKSSDAPALNDTAPSVQLVAALGCLRQEPPRGLSAVPPREVLGWALAHWRPERFRGLMKTSVDPAQHHGPGNSQ